MQSTFKFRMCNKFTWLMQLNGNPWTHDSNHPNTLTPLSQNDSQNDYLSTYPYYFHQSQNDVLLLLFLSIIQIVCNSPQPGRRYRVQVCQMWWLMVAWDISPTKQISPQQVCPGRGSLAQVHTGNSFISKSNQEAGFVLKSDQLHRTELITDDSLSPQKVGHSGKSFAEVDWWRQVWVPPSYY